MPTVPDPQVHVGADASAALQAALRLAHAADAGHHDELLDPAAATLRPAWQRFFALLGADGVASLPLRAAQVAEHIHRDGVSYNVYGGADAGQRPWPLGLLPLLIEPADWQAIETGIAQRARLLEAMLADCYGEQRLLQQGLLPPALVLGHPGYLRALEGVPPASGVRLHVAAFDMARGPDGRWWVVSQRTQAPSGLGYVLENRALISRQFPEAFRELRVQHLAFAYRGLLDTLLEQSAPLAAADGHAAPRLALLTPGPYNETYFEHAYLARQLGLPLVEGGDLTVRGERLWLKTVQGLEPVHGLLRRLDDDWCDPLELRPDSALGVPGLLQVLRAGRLVMANALGAGFLESPAVQGFLPAIAQRLLGERLVLPALPTWWCGEQAAWDATRERLSERVIRPSYPGVADRGFASVIASRLTPAQLAAWRARIDAAPDDHTVQHDLPFAQAPLWEAGAIRPRSALLRVYAIADGRGGHAVMPGGMTRVAAGPGHAVSIQQGGASLDAWVLSERPVEQLAMRPQRLKLEELAGHRRPVASRTAENLFWLGRYTERTEQLVRLAEAVVRLVGDDEEVPAPVLDAISLLAQQTGLAPWGVPSIARSPQVFERSVLAALADPQQQSLAFHLAALERLAGALRDRLSTSHQRLLRAMGEDFRAALTHAGGRALAEPALQDALEQLAQQLAAATGAQADRMTRDEGWRLLMAGRLVERLVAMGGTLRAFFAAGAVHASHGFDLLLALFDSSITYRARYPGRQETLALLELLVVDTANPRALACVLHRLATTALAALPGAPAELQELLPDIGGLAALCLPAGAADEAVVDDAAVVALAERCVDAGARLSDALGQRYFSFAA